MDKSYLFICDSSTTIGSGHVARCINLARSIKESRGGRCIFFHRDLVGKADFLIEKAGFVVEKYQDFSELPAILVERSPDPIGLIIFDNYSIDSILEKKLGSLSQKTLVIDDIFNRQHHCDILLNQNLIPNALDQYKDLVNPECHILTGPQYALVGKEYTESRQINVRKQLSEVLVFFGGTDPTRATIKYMELCVRFPQLKFVFVVGQSCPHRLELLDRVENVSNASVVVQAPSLLPLFLKSDLYLGAGGSVSWERLSTGLPGIVLAVAENQVEMSVQLANSGMQRYLGKDSEISLDMVEREILDMSYERRAKYHELALNLEVASNIKSLLTEIL